MKTKGKNYHARNTKPLISGCLQLFIQMCKVFFFFASRNNSRSETEHLLLKIILASFKLHYLFLTSNSLDEYFVVRTQIRSDALSQARMLFKAVSDFRFRSILYTERCAYIVLEHLCNALSKFKCLAAKHVMFEPTWNLFSHYVSTFGSKRHYHSSRFA